MFIEKLFGLIRKDIFNFIYKLIAKNGFLISDILRIEMKCCLEFENTYLIKLI